MFKIYIRAFHPWTNFSWGGLYYGGDNRTYSRNITARTTARIWYYASYDPWSNVRGRTEVGSDPSKHAIATAGANVVSTIPGVDVNGEESYDRRTELPWEVTEEFSLGTSNGVTSTNFRMNFGCRNFLTPFGDNVFGDVANIIFVPVLNVRMGILFNADDGSVSGEKSLEVHTNIFGDRFPNCECFLVDAEGNSVFLATSMRHGPAIKRLWGPGREMMATCGTKVGLSSEFVFSGRVIEFSHFTDHSPSVTRNKDKYLWESNRIDDYSGITSLEILNQRHEARAHSTNTMGQAG